ncbi:MAG: hypothetical protein ACYTEP_00105 [Planctomycetota bacterium]
MEASFRELSTLWQEMKALFLDRKTRTLGIVMALETPGFPAFFLGMIPEELATTPELANPMGHLMASILDAWEQIPGEDLASYGRFLTELFARAQDHVAICDIGARAWKGRRVLAPEDLHLVEDVRPPYFGEMAPAMQEDFFLLCLEDVLRATLESGEIGIVERFLEDPAAPVRAVALKVLLDGKPSSDWATWMALIEGLGREEILPLAEWIAETQDPAHAASILILFAASDRGNLGFLIAWSKLGLRELGVLEGTLYMEFDRMVPGQVGPPPKGFVDIPVVGDLQAMQMEGAMRQVVLDAYFSASFAQGKPMDLELLDWIARLDRNPRTRAQAWRTLGRSGGKEGMEKARTLLQDPDYAASLRRPGDPDDARIAHHLIQYFAPELDAGDRSLLLEEVRGLELSELDWKRLEGALVDG